MFLPRGIPYQILLRKSRVANSVCSAQHCLKALKTTKYNIAELCKGSTADSDSVCLGSNPSSAAKRKNRPLWSVFSFEIGVRIQTQTYTGRSLPSPKAKLADCAYRRGGILPCEEILLSLGKSGTIFAHFTPSGKLCIPGFAYARHASISGVLRGNTFPSIIKPTALREFTAR